MKIIVAYASAGAGHQKAAEAVYAYLREHHPHVACTVIDVVGNSSILFRFCYHFGYAFLVWHAQFLWRLGFWFTDAQGLRPFTRRIGEFSNRIHAAAFRRLLIKEDADVIISTHFVSSGVAAVLKYQKKIRANVITVITDYDVHTYWVCRGIDRYVVACDHTKHALVKQGISPEKVLVYGIPIGSDYLVSRDRGALRARLGLDPEKFTLLIATGSFGIGPIEKIVNVLKGEVQLIVACGRNGPLLERLKTLTQPGLVVFGFVNNIHELMAISDIIVTKPGGLSIAESLTMGLYPIFISPIPGQERGNIRVLARYGIGLAAHGPEAVRSVVLGFRDYPEYRAAMKDTVSILAKPHATKDICDAVC